MRETAGVKAALGVKGLDGFSVEEVDIRHLYGVLRRRKLRECVCTQPLQERGGGVCHLERGTQESARILRTRRL